MARGTAGTLGLVADSTVVFGAGKMRADIAEAVGKPIGAEGNTVEGGAGRMAWVAPAEDRGRTRQPGR